MMAVHLDSGKVSIEQAAVPSRPPGFALIRLLIAGICNTDLELQRGYYKFSGTPGHEFVGEVVESENAFLLGRRVVGEINIACGACDFCATGLGRHCSSRSVLGILKHPGAFAEYLTLPEANLHVIPVGMPVEHAVFVEPLAAACEILDQIQIPSGDEVAVLGDGKLGLLIAQVLLAHGFGVTVYGRYEEKVRLARRFGAEGCLAEELPKARYRFVVDSTGSPVGLRQAIAMVRPRGTVVMKSTIHGEVSIDTAPVIVNEISLVGSRCGRFEPAIELLQTNKIDVSGLLSAEFPLREAPLAFGLAGQRGILKVLLRNS